MLSIIVPVYLNEQFIPLLLTEFERIATEAKMRHGHTLEVVFVVDGSPDTSAARLSATLPAAGFESQLIEHSRNFGSFAAIRTGLESGRGDFFAVIAADLQEPPELALQFLDALSRGAADVVVGRREGRDDPISTQFSSGVFWGLYRRLVNAQIPPGGVDVFGCTREFRDKLIELGESHSSLVGQLYWLGFRRVEIAYRRGPRIYGTSTWTMRKKMRYLSDSIFAFTDLPIRLLLLGGAFSLIVATILGAVVFVLRLAGAIQVPGYAATILVVLFFGAMNAFGLGLVGSYAARAYENTKRRPTAVVQRTQTFIRQASRAQ